MVGIFEGIRMREAGDCRLEAIGEIWMRIRMRMKMKGGLKSRCGKSR